MDQPDVNPHRRKGLSTSLRAALTGATTAALAAALTLPAVAHAQPAPPPSPTPPPPVVGEPLAPPAPVPPPAPVDPNAPPPPVDPNAPPPPVDPNAPPPPVDPNAPPPPGRPQRAATPGRPQRAATATRAGAWPCRQRRRRLQLRHPGRLASLRCHAAVLRAGSAVEAAAGGGTAEYTAAERHQRAARPARPEAVRRRRGRQHQGCPAAGFGHGRVLHALPGHQGQSAGRSRWKPAAQTGVASYYEVKFTDTNKPNGQIWAGVVGAPTPPVRHAVSARRDGGSSCGWAPRPTRCHRVKRSRWPTRSVRGLRLRLRRRRTPTPLRHRRTRTLLRLTRTHRPRGPRSVSRSRSTRTLLQGCCPRPDGRMIVSFSAAEP